MMPGLNAREAPQLDIRSEAEYESFLEAMLDETPNSDDDEQSVGAASSPKVGLETPGFMRRHSSTDYGMLTVSHEVLVPEVRDAMSYDSFGQKPPSSHIRNGVIMQSRDHKMSLSEGDDRSSWSVYMEYDADSDDEAFMEHLQQQLYSGDPFDRRHEELHIVSPSHASASNGYRPIPQPPLTVRLLEQMIALLERHFELSRQFHLDHHEIAIRMAIEDANRTYDLCQQYLQQGNTRRRDSRLNNPLLDVCSSLRFNSRGIGAMSCHPPIIINSSSSTSSSVIPRTQSMITTYLTSNNNPSSSSRDIALNYSYSSSRVSANAGLGSRSVAYSNTKSYPVSWRPPPSIIHPVGALDADNATATNAPRMYPVERIAELLPFEWVKPTLRHALYSDPNDEVAILSKQSNTPAVTLSDEQELFVLNEVYKHWMVKRSRCTTSLLRCFHHYIMEQWSQDDRVTLPITADFSIDSMKAAYHHLHKMRKALDRARLITDRVRRRERLKRDVARASSDDDDHDNDDGGDDNDDSQLDHEDGSTELSR